MVLPIDMPTVENSASCARTPESLLRETLIDAARVGWTSRLIDLSRRNNLLFYKQTASGTLELPVSQRLMEFLGDGESVAITELVASDQDKISSIRAISRKGLENLEEKGRLRSISRSEGVHGPPMMADEIPLLLCSSSP